jgi:uncharacterized repeat protein (TIGR01451 family)
MKRILFLLILAGIACNISAQTASFSMITTPCDSDGVVVATFTGVPAPLRVYWNTDAGTITHTVSTGVTDTLRYFAGGAISIDVYSLSDTTIHFPAAFSGALNLPFGLASTSTNAICPANGTGTATITSGTGPFTYEWENTATSAITSVAAAASLPPGYYRLRVTNPLGCVLTQYASVSTSNDFTIDSATAITPAVCPGTGSATITPVGTGPFTYVWTDGGGTTVSTTNTLVHTGGSYTVTVTKALVCTETTSVFINTVPDFTMTLAGAPAICPANGTGTATITGGTGPFTYAWVAGGTTVSTAISASLPADYYTFTATDALGCSASGPVDINLVPDFTLSLAHTDAVCPGLGTGTATVSGGTGPFTYVWRHSGTTVSTAAAASLPGGDYNLTATDALGCSSSAAVTINVLPDFSTTVTATPANCTDGTVTPHITGGVAPFSYSWSNGATTSAITGLVAGYYSVSIVDAVGCVSALDSFSSLSAYVSQAITLTTTTATTPTTCVANNGAITATTYGGTAPYSYVWSNGGLTPTITGLTEGSYTAYVTDARGCTGLGSSYVSTIIPLAAMPAVTASACSSPTGSVSLTISGGTGPYTVYWYTTPPQSGPTATGIPAGTYGFRIQDAGGCIKYAYVTVPPVYSVSLGFNNTPASCTLADGSITALPAGGVGPYTYAWAGYGVTTPALTAIRSGSYSATVTDANGCMAEGSGYVPFTSPLTTTISSTEASCLFTADGTLNAVAHSGTPPYRYTLGATTNTTGAFTGLATSYFIVSVVDAAGCVSSVSTDIGYNTIDSDCYCTVQGYVYNDHNRNCIKDIGEPGLMYMNVSVNSFGSTYTDASGFYSIKVPSGSYHVADYVPALYGLSPCQPNNIPLTVAASPGCHITENFADTVKDSVFYHDITVTSWNYTAPRPGFSYTQATVIANEGTGYESSVISSYWADGGIFAPAFVPSAYYTGSPYLYHSSFLPTLAPGASMFFYEDYYIPPTVPLGTILVFKDTVSYMPPLSNWLADSTPWNNVSYFNPYTVSSYDPNFKEVQPKGVGSYGYILDADSVLTYTVHFQNTGTYPAQNVVVRDTLDANLNWSTLKPVYIPNNGKVDMDEHGGVTFTFTDINLPSASSDSFASNGMFTYSVRLKPGLPYGSQVRNRASIYFDFNAPVMTQGTLNTIGVQTAVHNVNQAAASSFVIYPNPAGASFTAMLNNTQASDGVMTITDIAGHNVMTQQLKLIAGPQSIQVGVRGFTPGMYLVTIQSEAGLQTQKLVIMR